MNERFLELIENSIKAHWGQPALTDLKGNTFYYKDLAEEIAKLHVVFELANIRKGDKIALMGRNSSRWAICFFGILSYGAVAVPILNDFKPDNVYHIINHSETKLFFVANAIWENLDKSAMPDASCFFSLDNYSMICAKDPDIEALYSQRDERFKKLYPETLRPENVKYHVEEPDELALLNYTSGTTGFSKGVMLPYRSLWSNTKYAAECLSFIKSGDNFVSVLPMAHMYGLAFEILNGINKGCHIHFLPRVPNPKSVIDSFMSVRPALVIAVPLIIEKIVKNNIFPMLKKPTMKIMYGMPGLKQLIQKKICSKLNDAFGNNFFEIVLGGAGLNQEIEAFLKAIGFRYTVGYGMTECGPLISYEQWDTFKFGSVGTVADRMEVKIDSADPEHETGEILVRGTNNMLGYYKNPKATAEVLMEDGWMRTGDLGIIDKDGFIFIRGRSKALILSSNGQNIYPEEIESLLNNMPYVSESLVIQKQEKLIGLVFPDREQAGKDGLTEHDLEVIIRNHLDDINQRIPNYCKLSELLLQQEAFEKTPKMSIKRFLYQEV
ncbi:MAG: AMP-binding protein [Tannerella sp.]|jgi:long-chain acyl-CoA synthetase|nr:AMP-binding protein [Tannerella sp.]